MDLIRNINGKLLRCGYTTGSSATAATKAALQLVLSGKEVERVKILTPSAVELSISVLEQAILETGPEGPKSAQAAVRKDSGDDPDVTNGCLIYSRVDLIDSGLEICGGQGVGKVTKAGLDQPVGEWAINSVPRRTIAEVVSEVSAEFNYRGGVKVTISVPEGEALAKKTFNPKLGIVGGISIIGTAGIVEPMSTRAIAETNRLEIKQLAERGEKKLLLAPGNYGKSFAEEQLGLDPAEIMTCSNFIGEAIDAAVESKISEILLIGHIGKLVKLGLGITNTHSANADGRMEMMVLLGLLAGLERPELLEIAAAATTDAALAVLWRENALDRAMEELRLRIDACLERRVPETSRIGFICFSNAEDFAGVLCHSPAAEDLIKLWSGRLKGEK
ncbi:MAG: cobalt-precorrin-5B (C(1))-methyltransferase CbiD [Eubacteriales bacterium]|nr:cobalt-precorrin-5B (C(1))-methyltransferase CbiD [Eubacteriales bacterium]